MKKILEETLLAIEEKKKCLMKKRPLDPLIEKNIYEWSKVGLTYASNAIEGNTLTEGETAQILEKGIAIGGKTIVEHLEALGHAKAVDLILRIEKSGEIHFLTNAKLKKEKRNSKYDRLTIYEYKVRELFSSEKKLSKIIEEDMKIYKEIFAKISNLHEDILNIDKWIVSGGSWGSSLAMIYAIQHSDKVNGIFCDSDDLEIFYYRNKCNIKFFFFNSNSCINNIFFYI